MAISLALLCFLHSLILIFKTYIGDVVISVNPFKKLNIYNDSDINAYRGRYKYECNPHMYDFLTESIYIVFTFMQIIE